MSELTGLQKKAVREGLVSGFPTWDELAAFTSDNLDLALATITGAVKGLSANAFDLVQWAGARGAVAKLVTAMRNTRPDNAKVQLAAASVELSAVATLDDKVVAGPTLEKIIGDNLVMLDVEKWRVAETQAESRVCRIDLGASAVGTGFLVGPDLVLTNYHVLEQLIDPEPGDAGDWCVRFDHKVGADGKTIVSGRVVALAKDWYVDHSKNNPPDGGDPSSDQLDFALIRIAEPVGAEPVSPKLADPRGWIAMSTTKVAFAKQRMIAILQHPSGGPMKLAMGMAEKLQLDASGTRVRHGVPTLPGSSGSPVFDQDWRLIALHHAGGPGIKPEYNEAIPIALIAARPKVAAVLPPPP